MKKEEQLLRALGNVKDSFVLEPSRYLGNPQKFLAHPKKRKWPAFAAMAAAAALVVTGLLVSIPATQKQAKEANNAPTATTRTEAISTQPAQAEALTLPEGWPSFRIEYDHELLEMVQGTDGLYLYPIEYSEELPVCEVKIEFLPNLLPYAAMEQSRKEMADDRTTIHQDQEMLRYLFVVSHGTAWNSRVEEVLIVGAGSAGSYRLTSKYFVEAAEGWGMTFSQICSSFSCTWEDSPNPEAEKVIMDFAEGYFSANHAAMLANYYGDSQNLRDMYTQDPSRVRIVSLQGLDELDSSIAHSGVAYISLAFLETEQSDSYTYLSMEVMKTRVGYRVSSFGLEK